MTKYKFELPFHVYVSDQLATEADSITPSGGFATVEEAIAVAKKIIDGQLIADFKKNPNDRPLMLLDGFLEFGFLPSVVGPVGQSSFNVRGYAENKCYELTGLPIPARFVWDKPNLP